MSCWRRKFGGQPGLASLVQSAAADPELQKKQQVSNMLPLKVLISSIVLVCQRPRRNDMLHCRCCTYGMPLVVRQNSAPQSLCP